MESSTVVLDKIIKLHGMFLFLEILHFQNQIQSEKDLRSIAVIIYRDIVLLCTNAVDKQSKL